MTNRQTTAVALKCFAIYFLSNILISLPTHLNLAAMLPDGMSPAQWHTTLLICIVAVNLICGFLLWKMASSLLKKSDDTPNNAPADYDKTLKNCLIILGLYFAVNALAALPRTIAALNQTLQAIENNMLPPNGGQTRAAISLLVPQILKLSIGLLLIGRPNQWLRAIRSIGEK